MGWPVIDCIQEPLAGIFNKVHQLVEEGRAGDQERLFMAFDAGKCAVTGPAQVQPQPLNG